MERTNHGYVKGDAFRWHSAGDGSSDHPETRLCPFRDAGTTRVWVVPVANQGQRKTNRVHSDPRSNTRPHRRRTPSDSEVARPPPRALECRSRRHVRVKDAGEKQAASRCLCSVQCSFFSVRGARSSVTMASPSRAPLPVWQIAVLSRVVMLGLMLLFDQAVDDYDTSGGLSPDDGFVNLGGKSQLHKSSPSKTCAALNGVVTWDSVYFLRIAESGFEHEQTHAFFPLFPLVVRGVAGGWTNVMRLVPFTNGDAIDSLVPSQCSLATSALLVSNAAHVMATVCLYKLGLIVLRDRDAARSAAVLFTLNPASVFHSAAYTESIFSLFSFAGFLFLEGESFGGRNLASLCFALACATRSNGALNGLLLACDFFVKVCPGVGVVWPENMSVTKLLKAVVEVKNKLKLVRATGAFALRCFVTLAPLFLVQWWGYVTYCLDNGDMTKSPDWCSIWRPFPNIYSHVQSKYWNVGFLKYYEAKQAPNFLLAAPVLLVSGLAAWEFLASYNSREGGGKGKGGVVGGNSQKDSKRHSLVGAKESSLRRRRNKVESRVQNCDDGTARSDDSWMLAHPVVPYLLKWFVMSIVSLTVMHVQVTTRFLSVTPGVYWFLAKRGMGDSENGKKWRTSISFYFAAYFLLGALMFPSFYPWT